MLHKALELRAALPARNFTWNMNMSRHVQQGVAERSESKGHINHWVPILVIGHIPSQWARGTEGKVRSGLGTQRGNRL